MFNGIIFNKGKVSRIDKRKKGINLFLKSSIRLNKNNIGDSISCDGVCLTLIGLNNNTPSDFNFTSTFRSLILNRIFLKFV